ncbi:MAG: MATE family efflux transporter [Alistipes sp.]|nr:MATE family efflux transporter [Candidatus Alistipes equi]
MAYDNRDKIDFGKERIPRLFGLIFIPTLLGMLADVAFILTDGIFVGHGIGSLGLASINLVAPTMMAITGLGVMFGMGCAILAAIHMAKNNIKAARINVTQAFLASIIFSLAVVALFYTFPSTILGWLGVSEELVPSTMEYFLWFVPTCFFIMISIVGSFVIRLDGSPKYSMYATVIPSLINIGLDWVFIYPCGWGLKGAALATDIGTMIGAIMTFYYMFFRTNTLGFYPLKFSKTSLRLSLRNIGYMARAGFPGLIGEAAISIMILAGNLSFGHYLSDTGIAAFSVICYIFPVVINVYIAVTAAAQPIISYNYGAGNMARAKGTLFFSTLVSISFSALVLLVFCITPKTIISIFLTPDQQAFAMACSGLPIFAAGFIPMAYNLSVIGYLQSIEQSVKSVFLTLLRGFVLVIGAFAFLPHVLNENGLWLAIPVSEGLTAIFCTLVFFKKRGKA